ncbi:restriction endonuclease subunit S [Staphylococcus aureus]|uniref:Type I restriction-modification system site-specificity determinate n=11 Tax=Staphylococcus TaxID=1279 RepID=A0A2S1FUJ4_STAAU|nr:restriction endonuclease subunit S [Staphylococcus aureus]AWD76421.1 type I restriction-modification system site-specificity determinate [Staphylococcus aureus]MCC1256228.1 restriction endonuclease subunit S [Staphylococcus aureus]MDI1940363.1 restriction endonuclease subunit S [Staphylococcus aureus]MVJ07569.1 restriction endonuclease subunit S [Staphylococcus aureus]SBE52328.1 type I restriction-modification system specificity protein [Staphylococcus aureus]
MSNTQKKNVPELRFPEFEGEWEEKKLGDTLEFIKDGTHGTHENVNNGPWLLSAKNIKNNKIVISSDDRKISESDYKKIYKNYKLEKGDLLLTIVGTIGRAAIVKNPNNIAFQRSVAILKTKATYDVEFIFQLFQTKYFKNLLLRKQVVSAQPGLYLGDIRKIKISITNIIEEQRKIGTFFRKIDRQIELEEQKLELLQQQKKGYMQKIFSQELRFKDENGNDYPEWEETTIKEIAQINTGKKDTKDAITNGSYDFYVRSPIVYKINTFSYEGEAILTVGDGVGVGKVFHYVNGKFDYHQRVYKISDFKNYYGLLLFYYFSQNFLKETKKYSAKTSVDSVRKDMIANMKVPRPIYIEQKKIGQFIKRVDNKTKIQKQVIELLKQRKKALLQKMFI